MVSYKHSGSKKKTKIQTIDDFAKQKLFDKYRFDNLVKARDKINTDFHLWMTFFTLAIGALFVGYYTIVPNSSELHIEIVLISCIGYFVSLLWHWSCKGYYWWVINWINLIIECEQNLPPNCSIYSCFVNMNDKGNYYNPLKPSSISNGRLLGLFSFVTTVVWGILFLFNFRDCFIKLFCNEEFVIRIFYFIRIIVSIIVSRCFCYFARYLKSEMKNHKNIIYDNFSKK
jgi:hypothetical protein